MENRVTTESTSYRLTKSQVALLVMAAATRDAEVAAAQQRHQALVNVVLDEHGVATSKPFSYSFAEENGSTVAVVSTTPPADVAPVK